MNLNHYIPKYLSINFFLLLFILTLSSCYNCNYKLTNKFIKTSKLRCSITNNLVIQKIEIDSFSKRLPIKYKVVEEISYESIENSKSRKKIYFRKNKRGNQVWIVKKLHKDKPAIISKKESIEFDTSSWYKITLLDGGNRFIVSLPQKNIFFYNNHNDKISIILEDEITQTGGF